MYIPNLHEEIDIVASFDDLDRTLAANARKPFKKTLKIYHYINNA
jgi:hypothetical protein